METKHYHQIARYFFGVSFGIGSILVLLLKTTELHYGLFDIGLLYILVAFMLNTLVFFWLVIITIIKKESSIFFYACLMLVNIPITLIYLIIIKF